MERTLEAGAQVQQVLKVECLDAFEDLPELHLALHAAGSPAAIHIPLPLFLNAFLQPGPVSHPTFSAHFAAFSEPSQEVRDTFCAKQSMDPKQVMAQVPSPPLSLSVSPLERSCVWDLKLARFGFGVELMPGGEKFLGAATLHTKNFKSQLLLKLEALPAQVQPLLHPIHSPFLSGSVCS